MSNVKCLRSWTNVCKCKEKGGSGINNIRDDNVALLGKWLWKALNNDDSDWV